MSGYSAAHQRYFVLYLPNGLPLVGKHARLEVDMEGPVPQIRMGIVLEEASAENLVDAGIFDVLELPQASTWEPVWLELDLVAEEALVTPHVDLLRHTEDPASLLLSMDAPVPDGEYLPPFHVITNYLLEGWAVHQRQLVPDEILALFKRTIRAT